MKISKIRKQMGLNQRDLAQMCETTQQQIAKIEGAVVDPKLSTLRKIATALQIEVVDLFYTKHEFLKEVNDYLKENKAPKRIQLSMLSSLIAKEKRIPVFHPYWEIAKYSNGKIVLLEDTK